MGMRKLLGKFPFFHRNRWENNLDRLEELIKRLRSDYDRLEKLTAELGSHLESAYKGKRPGKR